MTDETFDASYAVRSDLHNRHYRAASGPYGAHPDYYSRCQSRLPHSDPTRTLNPGNGKSKLTLVQRMNVDPRNLDIHDDGSKPRSPSPCPLMLWYRWMYV